MDQSEVIARMARSNIHPNNGEGFEPIPPTVFFDILRRKSAPDSKFEAMLCVLGYLNITLESACLAGGSMFTAPTVPGIQNTRASSSFYLPLEGLRDMFLVLQEDIEHWSWRIKYLLQNDSYLTRLYTSREFTNSSRYRKLYKALSKIGRIDGNYAHVFVRIFEDLKPVAMELRNFVHRLLQICREGNTLTIKADSENDTESVRSEITKTQTDNSKGDLATNTLNDFILQTAEPNASLYSLPFETYLANIPGPRDPSTPHWKHALASRHPVENLYVGEAELRVFANTKDLAKKAMRELRKTLELLETMSQLTDDTQVVWEGWWARWEAWDERVKRHREAKEEVEVVGYGDMVCE